MNDFLPKDINIKQAVLATLAYFDVFGVPLTREEVVDNLMLIKPDEPKVAIYLKESPLIKEVDGYYFVSKTLDLAGDFKRFLEKKERALSYWRKIRRFHFLLNACPFVSLITVCNSLPIGNVEEDSDIDLFVVTKPNRMFTARLFLTILTGVLGLRRYGTKIRKRFCLSFYITEDNLDLSQIAKKPYDIYLAYWLKTMEPLCGDYKIYQKLLQENSSWLKDYFYSVPELKRHYRKKSSWIKKTLEFLFDSDELEIKQKRYQLKRAQEKYAMLPDQSGTIISDTILKFHDKDVRSTVQNHWTHRLKELLRAF